MDDMIGNLPRARMSPRIINGVLKWYAGDTFELQVDITLEDQDGEPITIKETDTIEFEFFNKKRDTVKIFTFTNIVNGSVLLVFDEATTALFPAGEYTYDIYYDGYVRKTLSNDSVAIVE